MSICELATSVDVFSMLLLYGLGIWKLVEVSNWVGRKSEKFIKNGGLERLLCRHERSHITYVDEHFPDIRYRTCLKCGVEFREPTPGSTRKMLKHMAGGKYE